MEIYSIYDERLLEPGWRPTVQSCYYNEWKKYVMRQHIHKRIEIMYVVRGECIIRSQKENIKLLSGDFIFIDYSFPHALTIDNSRGCIVLNVEFVFEKVDKVTPDFKSIYENCEELRALFAQKKEYLRIKDSGELYRVLFSVVELAKDLKPSLSLDMWLAQLIITVAKLAFTRSTGTRADYVEAAKEYILRNYYHEIRISDIADYIHIHPAYLQRIFKKECGISIVDFLTEVRMKKAYELLVRTNMSIIDIANSVGINSQQYFNRLFKKVMKVTPKMLRDAALVDNRSINKLDETIWTRRSGLSETTIEIEDDFYSDKKQE